MGKKLCLCALAAILAMTAWERGATAGSAPPAEGKKWALQFGVTQNLTLTALQAGEVSIKQCLSTVSALRYGLGVSYDWDSDSGKNDDFTGRLAIAYQRYVNPSDAAKCYWGFGPTLAHRYRYALESDARSYMERSLGDFGIGLAAMIGVEWFAMNVISLHAEYRLDTSYHWVKNTYEYKSPSGSISRSQNTYEAFDFRNSSVLFGLSVYF